MYPICFKEGSAEIIEKKSRFIALVYPIYTAEDATEKIEEIKKKYWDARHHIYAYITMDGIARFSDDGEPSGTAGKPVLDLLINKEIRGTLIVVVRYFGGILLGTGGLVRAYTSAGVEGLNASEIVELEEGFSLYYEMNYDFYGKVRYLAETNQVHILHTEFLDKVFMQLVLRKDRKEQFLKLIENETAGKLHYTNIEEVKYIISNDEVILWDE